MKFTKLLGILLLIPFLSWTQNNWPDNFHLTTLDNGLEVLVIEDHSTKLVTIEIAVHNGAYCEDPEYDGLSHLYEHMFFKANRDYPSQAAFMDRVSELGISFNGTTSTERVNYFVTLLSHNMRPGMEFMNSAIRYPLFDTVEMRKENFVVSGEFKRNESNPLFFLRKQMQRELWGDLYSRKNTIGDYTIIESATKEKMEFIKSKYYYPNNSILVLAGDVSPQEGFQMAKEVFGDWQAADFDPFEKWPIPEFPPLQGEKRFVVENPVIQSPSISIGYHGPDTRNDVKATYTADVFSYILQQGNSKFQKALVESGLAHGVGLSYYTQKHVGPINISLAPNQDKIAEALKVLDQQIALFDDPDYFTDEQMQTAKDLLTIQDDYGKEQTSQFVHTVTFWWAVKNIDYYTNYVSEIQKITREDIQNYVRKYIQNQARRIGIIVSPEQRAKLNIDKIFLNN